MLSGTLCTFDYRNQPPQRRARLRSSRVMSKTLCTFDFSNQFPMTPCTLLESMGGVRPFARPTTTTDSLKGAIRDAFHALTQHSNTLVKDTHAFTCSWSTPLRFCQSKRESGGALRSPPRFELYLEGWDEDPLPLARNDPL